MFQNSVYSVFDLNPLSYEVLAVKILKISLILTVLISIVTKIFKKSEKALLEKISNFFFITCHKVTPY
jgi:hypothetical protein